MTISLTADQADQLCLFGWQDQGLLLCSTIAYEMSLRVTHYWGIYNLYDRIKFCLGTHSLLSTPVIVITDSLG
jgi:hypothetical protein